MRAALLDTNTLLLFLAGHAAPDRIGGKRLDSFDHEDFDRLTAKLADTQRHVSLPNILTEVSNLIGERGLKLGAPLVSALEHYCLGIDEVYAPSADVVRYPEFRRLGLTDTAILRRLREEVTIFTVDHHLSNRLQEIGAPVFNLMHFKTPRST
mgnify:CR=1 FL=1